MKTSIEKKGDKSIMILICNSGIYFYTFLVLYFYFMRKILISLILVTILSGCTFWEKKSDFTSLYRAYVITGMQKLEDLSVMV